MSLGYQFATSKFPSKMSGVTVYLDLEETPHKKPCIFCLIWKSGYDRLPAEEQQLIQIEAPDSSVKYVPAMRDNESGQFMQGAAVFEYLFDRLDENAANDVKAALKKTQQPRQENNPAAPKDAVAVSGWKNDLKQLFFGGGIVKKSLWILLLIAFGVFTVKYLMAQRAGSSTGAAVTASA